MDGISISVIIPVYNIAPYITRCIQSVLGQTYSAFEIIAVDDSSTDGSGQILDDLAARDGRLKVFHLENGGVSNARNFGMAEAAGKYIYFLDGDDWIEPETFEILHNAADARFDFVQASHDIVDETGASKCAAEFCSQDIFSSEDVLGNYFLEKITQSVWNKLFDARFVKQLSFDCTLSVGEDSKFIYEACKKARAIRLTARVTYHYFTRSGSVLHGKFAQKHLAPLALFDLQAEESKHSRKLYEMCIRRNVLYDFYLIRLILRAECHTGLLPALRSRILNKKWLMIFSKYCPLKYKAGILMLWCFPRMFMRVLN